VKKNLQQKVFPIVFLERKDFDKINGSTTFGRMAISKMTLGRMNISNIR
jgi:hypothetical protein